MIQFLLREFLAVAGVCFNVGLELVGVEIDAGAAGRRVRDLVGEVAG